MKYDVNILACPRCRAQGLQAEESSLRCSGCASEFPVREGLPFLATDPNLKTQLEEADYDERHQVNPKTSMQLYRKWNELFELYGISRSHILEIGSGTGLLTYGLVKSDSFENIHISDISAAFLKIIMQRMPAGSSRQYYYVCDANFLPFKKESFPVIVGNSVLHHFLDYPDTLRQCYEMLREGGIAVFTEPVREGHVVLAFFNALILELHARYKLKIFNKQELEAIRRMSVHVKKHLVLNNDRKRIARLEDKYIFSIREMEALGREIGFRKIRYINLMNPIGTPPSRGFKEHYETIMSRQHKIPMDKIARFDFLFTCFGNTFSDVVGDQLVTPFGFFVFEK